MSVVCPGTQNGLSSTGSQEIQYNLTKDRYDGCEIIMGNLEITQIESNWDFSFLKVKIILLLFLHLSTDLYAQGVEVYSYFSPPDNPRGDWLCPHCYEPLSGDSSRAITSHQRKQPL